jgi:hypothetical protein
MKAGSASSTCVFISHRLADLDVATAVGRYLTDIVGVDIYLSESDEHLQEALRKGDHEKIVQYIEVGIASSTHLLGILSNRTKGSWWVPFRIWSGETAKEGNRATPSRRGYRSSVVSQNRSNPSRQR